MLFDILPKNIFNFLKDCESKQSTKNNRITFHFRRFSSYFELESNIGKKLNLSDTRIIVGHYFDKNQRESMYCFGYDIILDTFFYCYIFDGDLQLVMNVLPSFIYNW